MKFIKGEVYTVVCCGKIMHKNDKRTATAYAKGLSMQDKKHEVCVYDSKRHLYEKYKRGRCITVDKKRTEINDNFHRYESPAVLAKRMCLAVASYK